MKKKENLHQTFPVDYIRMEICKVKEGFNSFNTHSVAISVVTTDASRYYVIYEPYGSDDSDGS